MDTYLPQDIQDGLDRARKAAALRSNKLRVEMPDGSWRPIMRAWEGGFALEPERASQIRGLVDLYDGVRHMSRCLIVASSQEAGETQFEYKRMTDASGTQPLDFVRRSDAPVGLLEDHS